MPSESDRQLTETSEAYNNIGRYDLNRWPLVYLPRSTTQPNFERLPAPPEMADMELACREQADDDEATQASARNTLFTVILLVLLATVLAVPLLLLFLPSVTFGLAGLVAVALFLFNAIFRRAISLRLLLTCVAIPLITGVVLFLALAVLQYRLLGTGLLIVAGVAVFWRYGRWPLRFYHEWLLTAPHVTPETRRSRDELQARPDYRLLLVLSAVILILPLFSPLLASFATVGVCVASATLRGFRRELIPLAQDVFARFLTYRPLSGAPGTWQPRYSYSQRRRATVLLSCVAFGAISLGLCYYFPSRLATGPVWPVVYYHAASRDQGAINLYWHFRMQDCPSGPGSEREGARFLANTVISRPYLGPYLTVLAIIKGRFTYSWVLIQGLFQLLILPPLALFSVYRPGLLELADVRRRLRDEQAKDSRSEWQCYVDRVRFSQHETRDRVTGRKIGEAEHLFLGIESVQKFPVLLDKRILSEHAYLVGETGSGKTALGIMPILMHLIQAHATRPTPEQAPAAGISNGDWTFNTPPPIVIIDLKGDPSLFHTIREQVDTRRAEMKITDPGDPRHAFRFFTCEKGRATHYFNPFTSLQTETRSLSQLCHLFLDSLSLSHGEGYGRSYYSRKNRMLLYQVLESKPTPRSFKELYDKLMERVESQPRLYHDAFELVSTIHALSKYPQLTSLQPLNRPEDAIHMPSVLEYGQIAYFWLPAALESISVREIAKLAIYSLLSAAIDRQVQGKPLVQAYLVVDEFQRIAGENFKVILEQARSFKLAAILANQSQQDLVTNDTDLRPTIRTNTRFKQYFGISDPREIHELCDLSGQELATMHGWTMEPIDGANLPRYEPRTEFQQKTEREFIKTRLTVNDILASGDHPLESIIRVSRGEGYTQYGGFPVPIRSTWPLHEHKYRAHAAATWPDQPQYELETVVPEQAPAQIDRERDYEAAQKIAEIDAKIEEIFAEEEQH